MKGWVGAAFAVAAFSGACGTDEGAAPEVTGSTIDTVEPAESTTVGSTNDQDRSPTSTAPGPDRGVAGDTGVSARVTEAGEPRRPNVVLFLTDDQTVESMRVLEQVDELIGRQGMTFETSIVNYPTCCPSRATLLTGQHAVNHGVRWNSPPSGGFQQFGDQETTFPVALEAAGYHTIHVGKYLNGYGFFRSDRFVPPGWSDFQGLISPSDSIYFDYAVYDNGDVVRYGSRVAEYQTDVLTERALDSIDRALDLGDPFYLQLAYLAPHSASGSPLGEFDAARLSDDHDLANWPVPEPAPRHDGLFDDEPLPQVPSFDEPDVGDKPSHMRRAELDADREAWIERNYRIELETLLAVDESVDRIVGRLADRGILDHTYLVFTSDNGFFHGEHRFPFSKYMPYEEAIRVPLLVRGPGIEPGTTQATPVSNIDLVPTVAELTGATPLREPDGRSLLPLLTDPAERWDRVLFVEGTAPATPGRRPYEAVRSADWMYTEYDNGAIELYHLAADPFQLDNLAGDPAIESEQAAHRRALDELRTCVGVACHDVTV